jgi:hypothetical protein
MGYGTKTVFFELVSSVALNIGINYLDEIVSIRSTLLMEKTRTVHQFVNYGANLNTARVQGHWLSTPCPANQ